MIVQAKTFADLLPNTMLGHYMILKHVAEGGMGHVYRAYEESLQREVAIKVLKIELASNPAQLRAFAEEAQKIAALRHPNIVPVYFVGQQGELYYFVMPFIEGSTLDDWIEAGTPMTPDQALWAFNQAIDALDWAWQHQIIHLDIKPSNFLVDPTGVILLTDFGLAKSLGAGEEDSSDCYGTPAYICPEQILKEHTDQRSDIYSLGATMFHLMTNQFLHDGDNIDQIILGHLESPFPHERARALGLPPGWINLFDRMTQKDPNDRFQDYASLREAVKNVDYLPPVKQASKARITTSIPVPNRSGQPKEYLYGLLNSKYLIWTHAAIDTGLERPREEVVGELGNTRKPLKLNSLVKPLKDMLKSGDADIADVAESMSLMPEVDRFIFALAGTGFCGGEAPATRKKAVRVVGEDIAQHIVLTGLLLREDFHPSEEFRWQAFWHHSMSVGLAATYLIDYLSAFESTHNGRKGVLGSFWGKRSAGKAREHAYMAGLIHGIGKLLLAEIVPYPYYVVLKTALEKQTDTPEHETALFGITHQEIADMWLYQNGFDSGLREVARNYSNFDRKGSVLCGAVAVANQLVKRHGIGYSGSPIVEIGNIYETPLWQGLAAQCGARSVTEEIMETEFVPAVGQLPKLEAVARD
jgi:serine/threonine protein kinase